MPVTEPAQKLRPTRSARLCELRSYSTVFTLSRLFDRFLFDTDRNDFHSLHLDDTCKQHLQFHRTQATRSDIEL